MRRCIRKRIDNDARLEAHRAFHARALAPVEAAIANWRGFVGARQSWERLKMLILNIPPVATTDILAPPRRTLPPEQPVFLPIEGEGWQRV